MIRRLGQLFSHIAMRYLPDTFVFAVLLTVVTFVLGMVVERQSPLAMASYWGNGFWNLLSFSMQMVLILVTGHVLAQTPMAKNILQRVVKCAHTPAQAIMLTTAVATCAAWFNWGFGLVMGALLAREMARAIKGIHYGLLVASAYSGFLVWHAGLSASIPLIMASTTDGPLSQLTGGHIVPLTQTIFSYQNYIPVLILLITLPFLNRALMPPSEQVVVLDPEHIQPDDEEVSPSSLETPAQHLENSHILTALIAIIALLYIGYYCYQRHPLNLNMVNFIFLILGLLLHKRPINYVRALRNAVNVSSGVILQFPFYAGIMGMITHSGLAITIANLFVHISTPETFTLFTFYASGLVNIFVPSGGGQWAVQGPAINAGCCCIRCS